MKCSSLSADVSDSAAMRKSSPQAEARFGAVHAAIHAAGVVDDAPLHSKERPSIEAVLRPKVAGAIALVEALRGKDLDFLALFSSSSVGARTGRSDRLCGSQRVPERLRAATGGRRRSGASRPVGRVAGSGHGGRGARTCSAAGQRDGRPSAAPATGGRWATARRCSARTSTPAPNGCSTSTGSAAPSPCSREPAFVEMVRAAVLASGAVPAGSAIELSDVSFTSPLIVPEKAPKVVETEVRREGDGSLSLTIRSTARREPGVEHSTARGRTFQTGCRGTIDVAAIEARCTLRRESFGPGEQLLPQERLLAFGPRWKAVRSIAFGRDEAIAHLELSDAHAADLDIFALHPALLDMATGCAFSLIEGAGPDRSVRAAVIWTAADRAATAAPARQPRPTATRIARRRRRPRRHARRRAGSRGRRDRRLRRQGRRPESARPSAARLTVRRRRSSGGSSTGSCRTRDSTSSVASSHRITRSRCSYRRSICTR